MIFVLLRNLSMIFVMLTWIEEEPIHLNPSDIIKDGKFLPYGVETDDE